VFYVNLPFGLLAIAGLALFMPKAELTRGFSFDWIGFGVLALGMGAFQVMLDRGQDQDWFSAREIVVEAVLAGLGFYLFLVHLMTAEHPFINPSIFRDMNFSAALVVMFAVGMVLLASSSLLAPYLQILANYPVATAGLVMAPRGFGTMAAMLVGGRLSSRFDPRLLMFGGVVLLVGSMWEMMGWTPDVPQQTIIVTIIVQGAGLGLVFTPLQVVAFATLPASRRTDATSLLSLFRNVGSAVGVSVTSAMLTRNMQVEHSVLAAGITPFNRVLQTGGPALNPATPHGAAVLDQMINHQSLIISYIDDYKLLMLTTMPTALLLLLMRRPARVKVASEHAAVID
jgi:DHA2 family multidrug resistance protein